MSGLLDPLSRAKSGVKWGLVAHTAAMFLVVTIYTATSLYYQSISYIDNRDFPGGPLRYQLSVSTSAISVIPNIMFLLNNWLADALLVSSFSDSVKKVSNVGPSSSSTAAMLSMPWVSGSSSSHA